MIIEKKEFIRRRFKFLSLMQDPFNILREMGIHLSAAGYTNIEITEDYLIAEGNIPLTLLAHADTAFKTKPQEFFYDREKTVMWSPNGMGADDKAGLVAIQFLAGDYLEEPLERRPHIIITDGEESGCIGAQKLIKKYPKFPFGECKYLVQLDRKGKEDCVFYDCANPEFIKYIESFGFKTNYGTYTDISVFGPAWGIAAVNLSVGYENEHTTSEYLNFTNLYLTMDKVEKMIADIDNASSFDYISNKPKYLWDSFYTSKCYLCGNKVSDFETIGVLDDTGHYRFICVDCVANPAIKICDSCNEMFLATEENTKCFKCRKEEKHGKRK
jgi:hypothetical protein